MAFEPFIAEICMLPYNFAPKGWAWCNGQIMSIAQNTALFSLLGTNYGGDGRVTFALPDLQGRAPMHPRQGPGLSPRALGENGGSDTVSLLSSEIPAHTHLLAFKQNVGVNVPDKLTDNPVNHYPIQVAENGEEVLYSTQESAIEMGSFKPEITVANSGGGIPHNNMQPYLTIYFAIALQGEFPQRS